jgi:SAM-dependent methyltransferase
LPGECDRCPACGSSALFDLDLHVLRKPIEGRRTAFISGCDGCGLVFRNPQPTARELTEFYSPAGEWGAPRANDERKLVQSKPRGNQGGSWARIFDPIGSALDVTSPPAGARVLDFGCGDGRLLDLLQDCGWETFGIETAVDTAFRRHRRLEAIPGEATFDLVVAHHVLEHVTNPLDVLRQLAAACRPGGHLLVSVPRLDTLPIHRDYKYVLNGTVHVTAYTWPCLQGLLARSGWTPVAPPPERVSKGGGRTTAARLRVIARRDDRAAQPADSAGNDARTAIRDYYRVGDSRGVFERLGFLRIAARRAEARRQRAVRARKAANRSVIA